MKPLAIILLLVTASVHSEESNTECVPAVDAADSMNVNQKECDYSNEGLNGFLQKAFKKGEDGAVLETGTAAGKNVISEEKSTKSGANKEKNKISNQKFNLKVEVEQWANLPVARAQLFPAALEKCGNGFAVIGEKYRSVATGKIELSMQFACE